MDKTISWMINGGRLDDPGFERNQANLRALHEARGAGPTIQSRLMAAVNAALGRPVVALSAGPSAAALDTVCCTA
jgi:hypothetical protein